MACAQWRKFLHSKLQDRALAVFVVESVQRWHVYGRSRWLLQSTMATAKGLWTKVKGLWTKVKARVWKIRPSWAVLLASECSKSFFHLWVWTWRCSTAQVETCWKVPGLHDQVNQRSQIPAKAARLIEALQKTLHWRFRSPRCYNKHCGVEMSRSHFCTCSPC